MAPPLKTPFLQSAHLIADQRATLSLESWLRFTLSLFPCKPLIVMLSNDSTTADLSTVLSKLSPYVEPMRAELVDSIRRFWSVPTEIDTHLLFPDQDKHSIPIQFTYAKRDQRWTFELSVTAGEKPSFVLTHRSGATSLARVLSRNIQNGGALKAKLQLQQAWRNYFPFRAMRDFQFREVHTDHDGLNGRIRLGYRCNQNCWFCWQDRKWPSPPMEKYQQWVDELVSLGIQSLNITGGEPTTFTELPMLMERAWKQGVGISLQTNAIRLRKSEYLQLLLEKGLSLAMVSYHSANAELSDRMTQAPGTHRLTQEGIAQLKQHDVPFTLNCVVEEANFSCLEELANDIARRFAGESLKMVSFSQPLDYHQGGWEKAVVSLERIQPYLVRACEILYDAAIPFQVGGSCGFPLCVLSGHPHLIKAQHQLGLRYHRSEVTHRDFADSCEICLANCQGLRKVYLDKFGAQFLQPILSLD